MKERRVGIVMAYALGVSLAAQVAAFAQTTPPAAPELALGEWMQTAQNTLISTINQAGGAIFVVAAAVFGIGVVMKIMGRITGS
jgi:hypothetical protein